MIRRTKKTRQRQFPDPRIQPTVISFLVLTLLITGCTDATDPGMGTSTGTSQDGQLAQAERIVKESMADPDPVIRINAIEVVAETKRMELMPTVQVMLKSPLVPVRFAACLAVGDLRYAPAARDIQALRTDPDENVRIAAAYASYFLGDTQAFETIHNALTNTNQTIRANAAMLLGKTGNKKALKSLWWTLSRQENEDRVRFQTAEAIAMLGDKEVYARLWAMLISVYADVRVMGVRAMGALGGTEARGALTTSLDDDVIEVRLAAAEQLAIMGDRSGETVVIDVFRKELDAGLEPQEQQRIRIFAARAIGRLGTARTTKYLPSLLDDASKSVPLAAARAAFQIKTP